MSTNEASRVTDDVRPAPGARPLRVLWLVKGLGPGGAERLLVSAAGAHDHAAFSFDVEYLLPWKDALVPELEALGVPTHCLGVRDERDLRWAGRLRKRLRTRPVDILHAHNPYPAGIARLVARTLPASVRPKLVFTVHNTWSSFRWPSRMLNGATYLLDDADLVVSEEVRETIWPPFRARTELVTHGVSLDAIDAASAGGPAIRAELGIGADEIVAVTIANFRAQKDYPNLLAAARILADRGVALRIVAVGQGPLEAEMRELHARLDLGDRVLLLGQRDDPLHVLAAGDIFTLASDNEGLPVAVMEAMTMGLPIVATAVGGVPGAIVEGVDGVLVRPSDPTALADALADLAADAPRRHRMGAAARVSGQRFDIRLAVRRIEDVYRTVTA